MVVGDAAGVPEVYFASILSQEDGDSMCIRTVGNIRAMQQSKNRINIYIINYRESRKSVQIFLTDLCLSPDDRLRSKPVLCDKRYPSPYLIKHYAMKTYGGVDVYIHVYLDLGTSWR
jgi:hypothetical protein